MSDSDSVIKVSLSTTSSESGIKVTLSKLTMAEKAKRNLSARKGVVTKAINTISNILADEESLDQDELKFNIEKLNNAFVALETALFDYDVVGQDEDDSFDVF